MATRARTRPFLVHTLGTRQSRRLGRPIATAAGLALALAISACGTTDDVDYEEQSVDVLYNDAMESLEEGEGRRAAELFDEVERQHPYSPWATKAQLMAAYSYYDGNQYDDAIAALDRFIRLHPASPDVPYAYYLKGLSYYERISDVGRDQNMSEDAHQVFEELVSRYPESAYARDATLKLDLIRDHLAGKEMSVGRFYLNRGHYIAAINRFRIVVERYQTTTHVPEALHRLVEAYLALGLNEQAQRMAAILGYNYPGSEWYIDSYQLVENKALRVREEPWYKFW